MENLTFREIPYESKDYVQELELRDRILRIPLGLSLYQEDLSREDKDMHLGAYLGESLAGVLILTKLSPEDFKMRQVAVSDTLQGEGIGTQLVTFAEGYAKRLGACHIVLHARKTAIPFYLKLGYQCMGDEFTEVTLPHNKMYKVLK